VTLFTARSSSDQVAGVGPGASLYRSSRRGLPSYFNVRFRIDLGLHSRPLTKGDRQPRGLTPPRNSGETCGAASDGDRLLRNPLLHSPLAT
jgi:hypothetical protein